MARLPRNWVPVKVANSPVASNAARRPYSRAVAAHSNPVTPSMQASDSSRAAVSPPALSASAPSGG